EKRGASTIFRATRRGPDTEISTSLRQFSNPIRGAWQKPKTTEWQLLQSATDLKIILKFSREPVLLQIARAGPSPAPLKQVYFAFEIETITTKAALQIVASLYVAVRAAEAQAVKEVFFLREVEQQVSDAILHPEHKQPPLETWLQKYPIFFRHYCKLPLFFNADVKRRRNLQDRSGIRGSRAHPWRTTNRTKPRAAFDYAAANAATAAASWVSKSAGTTRSGACAPRRKNTRKSGRRGVHENVVSRNGWQD
ncbi:unnamed protein product, partial [Amoebophrya sp. A120]